MKIVCSCLVVMASCLSCSSASAWSEKGHRMVGAIAQRRLTGPNLKKLKALFGSNVDLAKEAIWPDQVRGNKAYDRFKPWHYVDFPQSVDIQILLQNSLSKSERAQAWSAEENSSIPFIDSLRQFSDYLLDPHSAEGDALQAINQMAWLLTSRRATSEQRIFAIRYLAHLVGDIHQPLHAGNARDLGGNTCLVTWKGQNKIKHSDGVEADMNLHAVWDDSLLHVRQCSGHECTEDEYLAALFKEYPATVRKMQAEDYPGVFSAAEWAYQSAMLRESIYPKTKKNYCRDVSSGTAANEPIPAASKPELGDAYFQEHQFVVETQVLKGGLRLGKMLNELLPHIDPRSAPHKP